MDWLTCHSLIVCGVQMSFFKFWRLKRKSNHTSGGKIYSPPLDYQQIFIWGKLLSTYNLGIRLIKAQTKTFNILK